MQKHILVLGTLAALATAFSLQAQCAEGSFGTAVGTGDDTVLGIQSLGFAFPFNGTTFTDVHISTNGFVYLSNGGTPAPGGALCCTGTTVQLVAGSPKIAAYWSDLNIIAANGSAVKFNALPGKAVITWENAVEYGNTVQFTVQMQLSASGEITFTYDSRCQIRTGGDFLIGMSEGGGVAVPAASDFATSGSSTTNTNFELFTALGSFDLAGQSVLLVPTAPGYVWIPSACPNASNTNYGSGCYNLTNSFYQLTTTPAASSAALSNTGITMIPTGSGRLHGHPGRHLHGAVGRGDAADAGRRCAGDHAGADDAVPVRGWHGEHVHRLLERLGLGRDRQQRCLRAERGDDAQQSADRLVLVARLQPERGRQRPGQVRGDRHDDLHHLGRRLQLRRHDGR